MTHDCCTKSRTNHIIKYADDTTVVDLIRDGDELAYWGEVRHVADWCNTNNLAQNVEETKEIVVDFRRNRLSCAPRLLNNTGVEVVISTKFLGVQITANLTRALNLPGLVKKAQHGLHVLPFLEEKSTPPIFTPFYRTTSVLTSCISIFKGPAKMQIGTWCTEW